MLLEIIVNENGQRQTVTALAFFLFDERVFFITKDGAYYSANDLRTGYNVREANVCRCASFDEAEQYYLDLLKKYTANDRAIRYAAAEAHTGIIEENIAAYEAMCKEVENE